MKIKMTRSVIADKKARNVGEVVELSDKEAKFLVSRNLAKFHEEPKVSEKNTKAKK